jgi:hypothetical protein
MILEKDRVVTIAAENQRIVDVARELLSLEPSIADRNAVTRLQNQVRILLDSVERISHALTA